MPGSASLIYLLYDDQKPDIFRSVAERNSRVERGRNVHFPFSPSGGREKCAKAVQLHLPEKIEKVIL